MSLDQNVIPGVLAALETIVGDQPGQLRGVFLAEQFKVSGNGPVAWVLNTNLDIPDESGSDLERTVWNIEVRLLHSYRPDPRQAENVLAALVDPVRQVFRVHRKLIFQARNVNYPTSTIALARVRGGPWAYIEVNRVIYRMLVLNVLVTEKVAVTYSVGG